MEPNLTPSVSRDEIERSRSKLINSYLGQLATAAGTEATKERRALYCRALKDIGESQLKYAFEQALKHLGQFLPSIEQIRAWSEQWKPIDPIAETRKYLSRDDKPPTWEKLGRNAKATKEETARWLEEGKAKQRAHIATLEADPEWRAMAERCGAKARQAGNSAERTIAEVNPTKVPKDPKERAEWAHHKAIEQGWIDGREPGDE